MSNLIASSSNNQFLIRNLNALFARYPHEQQRLEPVLSKPAPLFPLVHFDLPAPPSVPPIRVLLLLGIGNPVFLATLLNDRTVQQECFALFIFEQNAEFLAYCFQNADLTQIINHSKTEWFLLHDEGSLRPALFRALKSEDKSAIMFNAQCFDLYRGFDVSDSMKPEVSERFVSPSMRTTYERINEIYKETTMHVLHNYGNLTDSLKGLEFTLKNRDFLLNCPGVEDLKDAFKGQAALLVGAGPSLDSAIETIKKHNDRVVVIAVDAALKPLVAAGVRVDYVTSIERDNLFQIPFFEGLENQSAELVAFPVVHPDVLATYPGKIRLVYRHYSFYAYFNKAYPKGILKCGGSTAHLGVRLADLMGCNKLFLIATDCAYEGKDGLFRSHCKGTGYPEWANYMPLEDFKTVRQHLPFLQAKANNGETITTNLTYYQWAKEFSEELGYLGNRMQITNCSEKGIAMSGIPYQPLETIGTLAPLTSSKPALPAVALNRNWNHKELIKNLRAWVVLSEDCIKEADIMLQQDSFPDNRVQLLQYVLNTRFQLDNLFVAFSIQCGAMEYFQLENRWWSLSRDPSTDLKLKMQVIKERFQLFNEISVKLVKLFEEEGSDGIKVH